MRFGAVAFEELESCLRRLDQDAQASDGGGAMSQGAV
jgi:hypothetical protein